SRKIDTSLPEYYRWTQWIFLRLYEKDLAYLANVPVNWCPALGTVLSNEEVKDGKYVETEDPVERRLMHQWMLKITVYAERLLEDLDLLDWPDGLKEMQRHWIGKSEGADIIFDIKDSDNTFTVFTTRPDTLFGATYCVLAPEHPLVSEITHPDAASAVNAYVTEAVNKSDLQRTDLATEKTGVFTGAYAINPCNNAPIPIWVADYVLMTYGTGAIMAVPGHDERDHEFASAFGISIVEVIKGGEKPIEEVPFVGDGVCVNSDFLNGLRVAEAKEKMIAWLECEGRGTRQVQYRLRDWLFSRQRYWGEPFPLAHLEDGTIVQLPDEELPVELPPIDAYKPTEDGKPPLARADEEWLKVRLPDGRIATRETNIMPQWAGSCWYYLRFLDAHNTEAPFDTALEQYWMPVDLYMGGAEHAVLHLLYARFWHKVLYDSGLVSTQEPFQGLVNQGTILAESYQKMSKSRFNVINPDDVIDRYGADAIRLYLLFIGPVTASTPWQDAGVEGVYRFLQRVWRLVIDEDSGELSEKLTDAAGTTESELWRELHKTIKQVTEDTESIDKMNTAISQMMIFVNTATQTKTLPKETLKIFLHLLAPYAPHIAQELWHRLSEAGFIAHEQWPTHDEAVLTSATVTIIAQVNGKLRNRLQLPADATNKEIEEAALADERVQRFIEGKPIRKVIVVPNRNLINIVV
ncbi:Leucine--tRNA ligase, partial [Geodia barretti]